MHSYESKVVLVLAVLKIESRALYMAGSTVPVNHMFNPIYKLLCHVFPCLKGEGREGVYIGSRFNFTYERDLFHFLKVKATNQALVPHSYNPSYSGVRDLEDHYSRPAPRK
jgi:hypothetical protein